MKPLSREEYKELLETGYVVRVIGDHAIEVVHEQDVAFEFFMTQLGLR